MNSDFFKRVIVDCPPAVPVPNEDLLGFTYPSDDEGPLFICNSCFGRLLFRGIHVPNTTPVWKGETVGACVCCNK